ncbi:hypothetical protein CLOSTHATH_02901 [Hungatella hathewayi DSM 13479]|uniref:Uncharacterized protein n=1 Tax=Hungatella hathewayi DSM 13479 TaxID=566550 RepID=D3AH15_9FIRM|nr:hypothetical protein CLOSTHATH_02901 [Hungatella hathewayi DSM 13479]
MSVIFISLPASLSVSLFLFVYKNSIPYINHIFTIPHVFPSVNTENLFFRISLSIM